MDYSQIYNIALGASGIFAGAGVLIKALSSVSTLIKAKSVMNNTKAVTEQTEKVVQSVKESLDTEIQIDITAQLEPITKQIREEYITSTNNVAAQMNAIKKLIVKLCEVMASSRKLTKDEQDAFTILIKSCDNVVNEPVPEKRSTLLVKCKDKLSDIVDGVKNAAEVADKITDGVVNITSKLTVV